MRIAFSYYVCKWRSIFKNWKSVNDYSALTGLGLALWYFFNRKLRVNIIDLSSTQHGYHHHHHHHHHPDSYMTERWLNWKRRRRDMWCSQSLGQQLLEVTIYNEFTSWISAVHKAVISIIIIIIIDITIRTATWQRGGWTERGDEGTCDVHHHLGQQLLEVTIYNEFTSWISAGHKAVIIIIVVIIRTVTWQRGVWTERGDEGTCDVHQPKAS